MYKYVVSTLYTPPVKDKMRHHFRYSVEAFEVAVEGIVDDYRRGGIPQPQGRKHPNVQIQPVRQRQNQSFPSQVQQDPQQFWAPQQPAPQWATQQPAPRWAPQPPEHHWAPQNQQFQNSAPPQITNSSGRRRYKGPRELTDGLCYPHFTYGDRAYSCEGGGCRMSGQLAQRPYPKNA